MAFDYSTRQVWLGHLQGSVQPGAAYLMCDSHATRLTPPMGWTLTDARGRPLGASNLEVA